jgi:GDP-L-fucose synthase
MKKTSKIYVAGHRGLVGSAIVRHLAKKGYKNLVLKTRAELNLLDQKSVADFFAAEKPEYVFLAAAKVGGIIANDAHPAEFIFENLTVQNNVIHQSYVNGAKKLLFLGSSCIYPRLAPQPIKEEYFMDGKLEPTNEAYAIAKIAGIMMCQAYDRQYGTNFISVMPTNLYGPNDSFDYEKAHVLPALMRRFHEAKMEGAKEVAVFGTGKAKREFLHVDDLADACIFLMNTYDKPEIVNIGTGKDVSIKTLAELTKKTVGYTGKIVWDTAKPDGTPRKWLSTNKLHKLGWKHKISLEEGMRSMYKWYRRRKS